jgi:hypothetical protein
LRDEFDRNFVLGIWPFGKSCGFLESVLHSRFFTWSLAALFAALPFVVTTEARAEDDEPVTDAAAAPADSEDADAAEAAEAAPKKVVSKHKAKPGKKKVATKHKKDKSKVATKKASKDKRRRSVRPKVTRAQQRARVRGPTKLAKADSKKVASALRARVTKLERQGDRAGAEVTRKLRRR